MPLNITKETAERLQQASSEEVALFRPEGTWSRVKRAEADYVDIHGRCWRLAKGTGPEAYEPLTQPPIQDVLRTLSDRIQTQVNMGTAERNIQNRSYTVELPYELVDAILDTQGLVLKSVHTYQVVSRDKVR